MINGIEVFDFHTHNLHAIPGSAIVNLPKEALLFPEDFTLCPGGWYSVGIHPWWTGGEDEEEQQLWESVCFWAKHPQIVAIGECGLDKLRGATMEVQEQFFECHLDLAEKLQKPVIVHCVRAFDRLLTLQRQHRPLVKWTVHGFRGKPELARQLLAAGMDLSFGQRYHQESWELVPEGRRHRETDDDF